MDIKQTKAPSYDGAVLYKVIYLPYSFILYDSCLCDFKTNFILKSQVVYHTIRFFARGFDKYFDLSQRVNRTFREMQDYYALKFY